MVKELRAGDFDILTVIYAALATGLIGTGRHWLMSATTADRCTLTGIQWKPVETIGQYWGSNAAELTEIHRAVRKWITLTWLKISSLPFCKALASDEFQWDSV
ncbi:hypothetical protein B0H13DRAFT_1855008 [Mycena leptocephala]|nr:hypothetical protein B0H13DRAFT_1855008 [Mycena leptocephala]